MSYFVLSKIDFLSFALTHAVNFALSLRKVLTIGGVRISGAFAMLTVGAAVFAVLGGCCFSGVGQRIAAFLGLFFGICFYTGSLGNGDIRWLRGLLFGTGKPAKTADATNS